MAKDLSTREIEKLIDREVRPMEFIKKGKTWSRTSPETICILTLQKARHQHYFNFYVSVLQLNPSRQLAEPFWHIFGRMFSPSVEEKIEWEKCLNDLHLEVSGKPRLTRLVEILQQKVMPLLQSFESLAGIKKALFSSQLRGMGVRTELQHLTGYEC